MATEVTAIFESADMAELALRQLRGSVQLQSFHIRHLSHHDPQRQRAQAQAAYFTGLTNTIGTGNFYPLAVMPGPILTPSIHHFEPDNREVMLEILTPDQEATRARNILVSNGGRKVS